MKCFRTLPVLSALLLSLSLLRMQGTPSLQAAPSQLSSSAHTTPIAALASARTGTEGTKRALLIGINEYKAASVSDLGGCVNDVELMKSLLVGKFDFPAENVLVLRDAQATRNAILDAIQKHLIEPAGPNDVLLLHYSGHGSQMTDVSGDELDTFDETIVPHDSRQGGVFDISDDELNGLVSQAVKKTPNVVVILDSCHSGSGVRAALTGNVIRQIPPDTREPPTPATFAIGTRGLTGGRSGFELEGSRYVLISGSRDDELSNEGSFEDRRHGTLTYFLTRALLALSAGSTYRDVMDAVKADVSLLYSSQHPQMEGWGADNVVFGTTQADTRPFVLVEPTEARTVSVAAGEIFGLQVGAKLLVYPPGTKSFPPNAATGQVRITEVQAFESKGEIVGASTIAAHSRAVLNEIRGRDFVAGVSFEGSIQADLLQAVKDGLKGYDSVRPEEKKEKAVLRVLGANRQVTLEGRDLDVLFSVPEAQANAAEELLKRIAHWARWYSLLELANPSPTVSVDLRLSRTNSPNEPLAEAVPEGADVMISVTNQSAGDLYITLLDLASEGSVTPLYPLAGMPDRLPPGKKLVQKVKTSVPAGSPKAVDVVKVIATAQPIPSGVFRMAPVPRSAAPAPRADETALERYLRLSTQGLSRNLTVDVDGWTTTQRTLQVVRPSFRLASFALHVSQQEKDKVRQVLSQSRAVCATATETTCAEIDRSLEGLDVIQLRPAEVRRGADVVRSRGEAFEQAYKLRDETGALRVEPLFDDQPQETRSSAPSQARSTGGNVDNPKATADPLWSLKHIRAQEAWAMLRSKTGRAEGAEAQGVLIAHPDTGYLQHPEIWIGNPNNKPVWPEKGYNYYEKTEDPADPLLDQRLLDNPAHGTGSGSAIVSPLGCQLTGATDCPTGVALGAQLVPLRVGRSVVHFNMGRMAQAIVDASGNDRTRVKVPTQLMSISLGGLPSWALWKAVRQAEKNGYLIVAASGNYVKTVVWPARFDSVIAVAATNVDCQPWAHTSMGRSVDISAPGESVWRATVDDKQNFVTGMGTGTTYATATTAGVAALWLAYHAGSPDFEDLKKRGQLTQVFRQLLQETSWRPDGAPNRLPPGVTCKPGTRWFPSLLGPGIVDAAALLSKPLPAAASAPRGSLLTSLQQLPLWASLYLPEVEAQIIESDYRNLFRLSPSSDLETIAFLEAEITHQYASNEDVSEALDSVVLQGNRTPEAFARARTVLLLQDLSTRLRTALKKD